MIMFGPKTINLGGGLLSLLPAASSLSLSLIGRGAVVAAAE